MATDASAQTSVRVGPVSHVSAESAERAHVEPHLAASATGRVLVAWYESMGEDRFFVAWPDSSSGISQVWGAPVDIERRP